MNAKTILQTCTHLPEDELAIILLRLSFRGRPCPQEWGILAESICVLTNTLLKTDHWDPDLLFSPCQQLVPSKQTLQDNIPFGEAKKLAVKIPIDPRGQADVYIDDIFALSVDITGAHNTKHLELVPLLEIHAAACPKHEREPIPCKEMSALTKLVAETGLEETKTILGWFFDFRTPPSTPAREQILGLEKGSGKANRDGSLHR
jgi:hypothetical protein